MINFTRHPDEKPAVQEKVWSLYEARLKPAVESNHHHQVLQLAEEMVQSGADSFALRVAAFCSLKAAKECRQWDKVVEWCARLDREQLTTTPRKFGERKSLSDRERYYYALIKAFLELEKWEEALTQCEMPLMDFDRNQDFARWKAQSLAQLGDLQPALDILHRLRQSGRCRWYILSDYARLLYQQQDFTQAWQVALEASGAPVEDSHKLGLFELMAQILLQQGQIAAAVDHIGWCMALRSREGWGKTKALEDLEIQVCDAVDGWEPNDPAHWRDRATMHWGLKPAQQPKGGGPRPTGQIEQFMVNRNYCFVLHEGQRYYTLVKDVPQASRKDGSRVQFRLTPHYDPKKKAESQRAVQLSPL